MRALSKDRSLNEITVLAFRAGVDVLAVGADVGYTRLDRRTTYRALLDVVKADPALQTRLDDSVRRILTVKARYGILDWQPVSYDPQALGKPENRGVARQVAQASVTLLSDKNRLVPLPADAKVLLVLPSTTETLAGPLRTCKKNMVVVRTRQSPTRGEIAAVMRRAASFDVVVVATSNALDWPGQIALVNALLDKPAKPVIAVAMQSPYDLLGYPTVSTYLTAYSDVPYSLDAIADVLCGKSRRWRFARADCAIQAVTC